MGAVRLGLGGAVGFALGAVLRCAVNPAYFGWSLGLYVPWRARPRPSLAAAAAGSIYPAAAGSRTPAAELSRAAL